MHYPGLPSHAQHERATALFGGRYGGLIGFELQPQIDKTLEYEKHEFPDPSFLGEVVLIAGVDGTFGPRTSAALSEFQSSHGIDESGIGPATLEALGVDVPDDAPIVYLRAGAWDFDY